MRKRIAFVMLVVGLSFLPFSVVHAQESQPGCWDSEAGICRPAGYEKEGGLVCGQNWPQSADMCPAQTPEATETPPPVVEGKVEPPIQSPQDPRWGNTGGRDWGRDSEDCWDREAEEGLATARAQRAATPQPSSSEGGKVEIRVPAGSGGGLLLFGGLFLALIIIAVSSLKMGVCSA